MTLSVVRSHPPPTVENWIHASVLVLNASYQALHEVTADRAVTLVLAGAAEAMFAREPYFPIRSQRHEIALPETIRLLRYVHVAQRPAVHDESQATAAGVLRRDDRRCGYCGARAHTVDHIRPRSRGGPNTWANLVACCAPCNTAKADRTPEEAGLTLLWQPKAPDPLAKRQRDIWRRLAE
ncbi:HNH endonuclease [Nocardia asteroides]|uniref:HNH endonuclease n=1 Tax=Nocardia asteroides TaxID=1824 RepID=UPI001E3B84A4|nr:HNH endonuclease [Nocardia asteroides]UGT61523.1 HNH endonuclease [Nocardia asteroides]